MDSQHKRSFRRILFILFGIGITISLVICFFSLVKVFDIKNITVSGDAATVEINKQRFIGNILFFPTKEITDEILSDNPLVKSVVIKKKFPSTLELIIERRIPVAAIVTQNGSIQGIDAEGIITGDTLNTQLPRIFTAIPAVHPGQRIQTVFVTDALHVISTEKDTLKIIEFQEMDTSSFRAHTDTSDIFFPQKTDISPILDTLQTLIAGFRIKGTMPKTVDLRFGKPVVQF